MNSQAGIITADFLFAIAIAMGMFTIVFAMSFTLSTVEIAQYVAFATARAGSVGNLDPDEQKKNAVGKYKQLVEDKKSPLYPIFHNGWFSLSKPEELDIRQGSGVPGGQNFYKELAPGAKKNFYFQGVSIKFVAHLLNLKIPFIGQMGEEGGFSSYVNGILIREPSMKECLAFFESRKSQLSSLESGKSFYKESKYFRMEDNGC